MRVAGFLLCLLYWGTIACASERVDPRPNIIVFYTDDHGYADLSCQGVFDDVRTPNVDALARSGLRALHGYSTAPQCVPSRAGLLIGKFQAKFGVEANGRSLEGFDRETTFAKRLQDSGYVTGQFGKWHLGPGSEITKHGFTHVFAQNSGAPHFANITLDGEDRTMGVVKPELYHVDACSKAASSLIHRYHDKPFMLYVAYRAPHVPLDATPKYLARFPGKMPERRRQALAMLAAVDDGVGLVMKTLKEHDLTENTLVFYIGDNGAPLKIHKLDAPGGGPGWDGSLNDPLNGEKGMLTEGGMHTPFVVSWPSVIPSGQEFKHPISALDVAATATAIAKIETTAAELDGVNLIPFLSGKNKAAPHDALTWRWIDQSAIREGKWKLLLGGPREYLFDLDTDLEEKHNLVAKHPEIANRLRKRLESWSEELSPPGLSKTLSASGAWSNYYDFYLEGKKVPRPAVKPPASKTLGRWTVRNATMEQADGVIKITPDRTAKSPLFIRNGMSLAGPVTVSLSLKTSGKGPATIAWRTDKEREFKPENSKVLSLETTTEWQDVSTTLSSDATIVHVRVQMPSGATSLKSLVLKPTDGDSIVIGKER